MLSDRTKWFTLVLILIATLPFTGCSSTGGSGDSDDSLLLVANSDDNTLTIINSSTHTVESTVTLSGTYPWEITLSANETVAYVQNRDSNNISIVSIVGGTELGTIALTNTQPSKAVVASDGFLYVTHANAAVVTKVDIGAAVPAEDSTIAITADSGGAIAESIDGAFLYVGSLTDTELCKINIASGIEISAVDTISIADIKINTDGKAYIAPVSGTSIYVFDTLTDTPDPEVEMTIGNLTMTDLIIEDGKVFISLNAGDNSGGVAEFATNVDQTDFLYDSWDNNSYTVALPFTFNFIGTGYNSVEMNSNGVISFDGYTDHSIGVENILGFTPNNENLDSRFIFHYASRTYPDRAVFQWLSSTNTDNNNVNSFYRAQVVLYNDNTARFNILGSGPEADLEDDGWQYGVGDDSGTALINLRDTYDSPFSIERLSLTWDPATPNTMTEAAFAWEDIGVNFSPATLSPSAGYVDGVVVDGSYIYMAIPKNFNDDAVSEVLVYDRDTMLPLADTITVGAGTRAITIADPVPVWPSTNTPIYED